MKEIIQALKNERDGLVVKIKAIDHLLGVYSYVDNEKETTEYWQSILPKATKENKSSALKMKNKPLPPQKDFFRLLDPKKNINDLLAFVNKFFDLDIRDKNRTTDYIFARHIFCYYSRIKLNFKLREVTVASQSKVHATVLNSIKRYKVLYMTNEEFKVKADLFEKEFKSL